MPITVVLADDHRLVRDGLSALIASTADIAVVAQAEDGEATLREVQAHEPDVAVVDVGMPKLTGVEVARKARDLGLRTAVVVVTQYTEPGIVKAAVEAGVAGYVVKMAAGHELLDAIRAAAEGLLYLSPQVARAAVSRAGVEPGELALTPRERDVLRLIAEGLTSKEVAGRLGLKPRSVDAYRADIMAKLGIHHTAGLVKYALRHQLTTLDDPPATAAAT